MCGRAGYIAHECLQWKDGKLESCWGCNKKKKETCGGQASHRRGKKRGFLPLSVCRSVPLQFLTLSVNGVKTQALVDSGAQVSVMSKELFKRLTKKPPLTSVKEQVVGVGKVLLCVRGRCKLQVTVGSHTTEADCIVVSDLNASFILGLPTQAQLGLSIHLAEWVVKINGEEFATNMQVRKCGGEANEVTAVVANIAPQLKEEQCRQLESLLEKDKDVLVKELEDREAVKGVEHKTKLEPGTKPICIPVRRFLPKEMEALTKQVKELKEKKVIQPSNSPWCACALFFFSQSILWASASEPAGSVPATQS